LYFRLKIYFRRYSRFFASENEEKEKEKDNKQPIDVSEKDQSLEFLTEEELNAMESTQPTVYQCTICPEKILCSLEEVRRHISSKFHHKRERKLQHLIQEGKVADMQTLEALYELKQTQRDNNESDKTCNDNDDKKNAKSPNFNANNSNNNMCTNKNDTAKNRKRKRNDEDTNEKLQSTTESFSRRPKQNLSTFEDEEKRPSCSGNKSNDYLSQTIAFRPHKKKHKHMQRR
jgi:hypothetical protein